jgi:hypothetical protein
MDPDAIAAVVRAAGGPHAEEFLGLVARNLKDPAMRVRANQILARMRRLE